MFLNMQEHQYDPLNILWHSPHSVFVHIQVRL